MALCDRARVPEAWHCATGLESLREPRRGKTELQLGCSSGVELTEFRRQAVWAAEGGARAVTQAPWRIQENLEWIPDLGQGVIYTVGVWFGFVQIVTACWFFSLEVTKYLTF